MSKKTYGEGADPASIPSTADRIKFYGIMFAIFIGAIVMGFFMFPGDGAIYFGIFITALFLLLLLINFMGNKLAGKIYFAIEDGVLYKYKNNKLVAKNIIASSTFEMQNATTEYNTTDYYLIVKEGSKEPVNYTSVMVGQEAFAEFMSDLNAIMGQQTQE